jgi:hypothetical protein
MKKNWSGKVKCEIDKRLTSKNDLVEVEEATTRRIRWRRRE